MAVEFEAKERYTMADLLQIMYLLRTPDGCPWDREQTHQSIRGDFLEETHEALEAIDNGDVAGMREELGDVLLQVVFHAQIAAENDEFHFEDVVHDLCCKLVERHPHVFGTATAADTAQALKNWDAIKRSSKGCKQQTQLLDGVPHSLPALMRADKVLSRAKRVGFVPPADVNTVVEKAAMLADDPQRVIGDMLFTLVMLSRVYHVDPEQALSLAIGRFIDRFAAMERDINKDGGDIAAVSPAQWQTLWEKSFCP